MPKGYLKYLKETSFRCYVSLEFKSWNSLRTISKYSNIVMYVHVIDIFIS